MERLFSPENQQEKRLAFRARDSTPVYKPGEYGGTEKTGGHCATVSPDNRASPFTCCLPLIGELLLATSGPTILVEFMPEGKLSLLWPYHTTV